MYKCYKRDNSKYVVEGDRRWPCYKEPSWHIVTYSVNILFLILLRVYLHFSIVYTIINLLLVTNKVLSSNILTLHCHVLEALEVFIEFQVFRAVQLGYIV